MIQDGIVTTATHQELQRLYTHAQQVLGEVYLPEAVLTESMSGQWRAALCYIAPQMSAKAAERAYVERILRPAKEFRFPDWYIERSENFQP